MNKPKPKAAQKSLLSYFGRRTLIVCIVILIGLIAMTMSMKISNCSVLVLSLIHIFESLRFPEEGSSPQG